MMKNLVFVHGINTRGAEYDLAFGRIRSAVAARCSEVAVVPCRWGDDLGAILRGGGKSIPRYDQTRGLGEPESEVVDEADLWGLLDRDPMAELRLMGLRPAPPPAPFDPRGASRPSKR
jgi:hypothetical protein